MPVLTQFPKRGIFPGPRLVYLDNYAGHMRNFTGSVGCWGFLGRGWGGGVGGGGRVKPFYYAKTMTREGRGV